MIKDIGNRNINSKEEYEQALEELDNLWFIAEMSDDYSRTLSEQADIREARKKLYNQCIEKGFVL
jgi:hypothetical protein